MKLCDGSLELHYIIEFWAEISPRYHYAAENIRNFPDSVIHALHQVSDESKCYIWQETFMNTFMESYETEENSYECLECEAAMPELMDVDVSIERTQDEIMVRVPVKAVLQMFIGFGKRKGYQVKIMEPDEVMDIILSELDNGSYDYEFATCSEVMMVSALRYLAKASSAKGMVNAPIVSRFDVLPI